MLISCKLSFIIRLASSNLFCNQVSEEVIQKIVA